VEYEGGTGWVEKNKDEVPEGLADVMKESKGLLGEIWKRIKGAEEEKGGKKKRGTVGSKFKDSLNELMDLIMSTDPHYIRCLKPNDDSVPGHFVENRVLEQLRYGGVLEAVRVARMGFPVRMKREEVRLNEERSDDLVLHSAITKTLSARRFAPPSSRSGTRLFSAAGRGRGLSRRPGVAGGSEPFRTWRERGGEGFTNCY
jgi:hypothetical protein